MICETLMNVKIMLPFDHATGLVVCRNALEIDVCQTNKLPYCVAMSIKGPSFTAMDALNPRFQRGDLKLMLSLPGAIRWFQNWHLGDTSVRQLVLNNLEEINEAGRIRIICKVNEVHSGFGARRKFDTTVFCNAKKDFAISILFRE